MGGPTESLKSGYSAMQACLDQNYLFASWNEVWYGVGCVSGPFSGMLFGDIESGKKVPSRGKKICAMKRRTFYLFKDRGE
jgi:hypothetical protein